jgi:pyruvate kinase
MPAKTILCTLGPASMRPDIVKELDARRIDMFRINLSHTPPDAVESTIEFVRRYSSTPICIDTEGAQVRCGAMMPGVVLTKGQAIKLTSTDSVGTADTLAVRPPSVLEELGVGSALQVDFDGAELRVTSVGEGDVEAIVVDGGHVGSNKAVTIEPLPRLPPFTDHDVTAVKLSVRHGIRHFALSFTNEAEDVARFRDLLPPDSYVIAKIENKTGVQNVEGITSAADAVLIDRGDLSREVAIEYVPVYQKHIIRCANALNTPVFVATNLLESMITHRVPTVAEANDIVNTLYDGAHGLVLAAETAIGEHPVQSVDMVLRVLEAFERSTAGPVLGEQPAAAGGPALRS